MKKPVSYFVVLVLGFLVGLYIRKPNILTNLDLSFIGNLASITGVSIITIISLATLFLVFLYKNGKQFIPFILLYVIAYRKRYFRQLVPFQLGWWRYFLVSWCLYRLENKLSYRSIANSDTQLFGRNFFTEDDKYSISKDELSKLYTNAIRPLTLFWNSKSNGLKVALCLNLKDFKSKDMDISAIALNHYRFIRILGISLESEELLYIWRSLIKTSSKLSNNKSLLLINYDSKGEIKITSSDFKDIADTFVFYLDIQQKVVFQDKIGEYRRYTPVHKLSLIEKYYQP